MSPDDSVIKGGIPSDATSHALAESGRAYAIYIQGGSQTSLTLEIPTGGYQAEWVNPCTGEIDRAEYVNHRGGSFTLALPTYSEDIALRLVRR